MDIYLKRKLFDLQPPIQDNDAHDQVEPSSNISRIDDLSNLPTDPGLRIQISDYHPNDQDKIRREYLQLGPYQPSDYKFPQKKIGNKLHCFNPSWFTEYGSWLEYSVAKDAAFCLHCYLFGPNIGDQGGDGVFVAKGFSNWKNNEIFQTHVGGTNSAHNQAYLKSQDLMKQKHHILYFCPRKLGQTQIEYDYQIRLGASIESMRFLLRQGLIFHGNGESQEDSNYPGIFFDLLQLLAVFCEGIKKVILQNAPENLRLITPDIQNDIVNAAASVTLSVIQKDLVNSLFAVLIGQPWDASMEEQMTIVLRYVDKRGCVIERFIGIMSVSENEITPFSLKTTLEALFCKFGLSTLNLRGLGYNGASSMRSRFNGFISLIQKENKSAFYVHCFAHELQVELINVAKHHFPIYMLFRSVSKVVNVVGISCKHLDIHRQKQAIEIVDKLKSGEHSASQRVNEETDLEGCDETHWAPHYMTLVSLIDMFSSVIDMLEFIEEDELCTEHRGEAYSLLDMMLSFDFIFSLHLMRKILGITYDLSQTLQQKDPDIVKAVTLIQISKQQLQKMREKGWDEFFAEISSFCVNHDIIVPHMDDNIALPGLRRSREVITKLNYYQGRFFHNCIDMQLEELNSRFDEVNMEMLLCVSSLNPSDSFAAFDKKNLIRLAQFYPIDFSTTDLMVLQGQLESYITDMRSNNAFSTVNGISGLVQKMIETKKDIEHPWVFLLMKLSLILPVASATVERSFSIVHTVDNLLRNRKADEWVNDCLVTYIERDIFDDIDREVITQRFESIRMIRGHL